MGRRGEGVGWGCEREAEGRGEWEVARNDDSVLSPQQ